MGDSDFPEDVMATTDFLDTREAANLLGFSGPDSLRTALYRPGSGKKVRGVEPVRDPDSGRLLWPLMAIVKARDSAPARKGVV
jgi:hypothetical protein